MHIVDTLIEERAERLKVERRGRLVGEVARRRGRAAVTAGAVRVPHAGRRLQEQDVCHRGPRPRVRD